MGDHKEYNNLGMNGWVELLSGNDEHWLCTSDLKVDTQDVLRVCLPTQRIQYKMLIAFVRSFYSSLCASNAVFFCSTDLFDFLRDGFDPIIKPKPITVETYQDCPHAR